MKLCTNTKIWINVVVIAIIFVLVPMFCFDTSTILLQKTDKTSPKVYEIWHVETFEGGSVSRDRFLKNCALEYEQSNTNKMFLVKTIAPSDLQNSLASATPDIISFGYGVGEIVLPYLQSLECEYAVRDDVLTSAEYAGRLMAVPYLMSGYAYFAQGDKSAKELLSAGKSLYSGNVGYTSAQRIYGDTVVNQGKEMTAYECYCDFAVKKCDVLLGTGRDVYRVQNLINNGRISATIECVNGYTDLVQYIGVINKNSDTLAYIDWLMSSDYQDNLSKYHLYSTQQKRLYVLEPYASMESALSGDLYVPNVFERKVNV